MQTICAICFPVWLGALAIFLMVLFVFFLTAMAVALMLYKVSGGNDDVMMYDRPAPPDDFLC